MAKYKDIVMGTGGEPVPSWPLPFAYFAMDDVSNVDPNIGTDTDKSLSDPDLTYDAESPTKDQTGADNSDGCYNFANGGESIANYTALKGYSWDAVSVGVWVKHDLTSNQLILPRMLYCQYNNPNGYTLGILPGGGAVFSFHRNNTDGDGGIALGNTVPRNQWRFLLGTFSRANNRLRIFEDGVQIDEGFFNTGVQKVANADIRVGNSQTTKIGASDGTSAEYPFDVYNGKMAHLMIWRGVELSPTDVSGLWAAGSGPSSVPVEVTVTTTGGVPIESARVYIRESGGGAVILNTTTNASGVASGLFTGTTPQVIEGWVRKATTGTLYKQFTLGGSISANGYITTALMVEDE